LSITTLIFVVSRKIQDRYIEFIANAKPRAISTPVKPQQHCWLLRVLVPSKVIPRCGLKCDSGGWDGLFPSLLSQFQIVLIESTHDQYLPGTASVLHWPHTAHMPLYLTRHLNLDPVPCLTHLSVGITRKCNSKTRGTGKNENCVQYRGYDWVGN